MSCRVCKHGLNRVWIIGCDGNVQICGWTAFSIGKLTENSFEDIWNGERAKLFRQSMIDGSYRYCNPAKCPHCANGRLEEQFVDFNVPEYPKFLSLSYQKECNYACVFCRNSIYKPTKEEINRYHILEQRLAKLLPHVKKISANGIGEFFCSSSIMGLFSKENISSDQEIGIETNGSLFNEKNWEKIKHLGSHKLSVSVTVTSFNESTYKYMSGTDLPVSNIINNLKFISQLRQEGKIDKFEIATVVCERNFREMPEFVKTCLNEFDMDTIRLRFYEPYGVKSRDTEWFYDVRNEFHPYHDEFVKVMENQIFKNEKVWKWQGEKDSLQKESPYILENRKCRTLEKIIYDDRLKEKIKKFIDKSKLEKVAIYGGRGIGRAYQKILKDNGLQINTIFDSYEEPSQNENYAVVRPDYDNVSDFDLILIAPSVFCDNILENLSRLKYKGTAKSMDDFVCELNNYC